MNADQKSVFVKFHWSPVLGTHSVVWDEAVKINGADPDFHRRDLWEAIEAGDFPNGSSGSRSSRNRRPRSSASTCWTRRRSSRRNSCLSDRSESSLNRNPDNFFAETEQVAFCTQNVVPGIDFTNDPLLQGRNFVPGHADQPPRGPNFHELPINAL